MLKTSLQTMGLVAAVLVGILAGTNTVSASDPQTSDDQLEARACDDDACSALCASHGRCGSCNSHGACVCTLPACP